MHTVELLREATGLAKRLGYQVRQEWLGGVMGGGCELAGRKILFIDLALGPADQFQQVLDTLRREPEALSLPMDHALRELLVVRRSA